MFQKKDGPLNIVRQSVFTLLQSRSLRAPFSWRVVLLEAPRLCNPLTAMLIPPVTRAERTWSQMDIQIVYRGINVTNVNFLCKNAVAK